MRPDLRYTESPRQERQDWANLRSLWPYLWEYRGRVLWSLGCLVLAKIANIGVPLLLKQIVDRLDPSRQITLVLPVSLLLAYGALKLGNALFSELRDVLFARVRYRAMRRLTMRTLAHLHALSLRFHLERKTGAISRDLERGARSLSTLLNYLAFSILPVLVEFLLAAVLLLGRYPPIFTLIVLASIVAYVTFTLAITHWRMEHRHLMNRLESQSNNEAIDSLINYETVKFFGNEDWELRRCDDTLAAWENSAVLSQTSMSALNFGQGAIIALGVTLMMFAAAAQVAAGQLSLGDLVLVNALLLQLFIPLNFLGIVYRQIKYALADMDDLVRLLAREPEIRDAGDAKTLALPRGELRFEQVDFSYQPDRQILFDVSFTIPPGRKLAVVGASGAGKSTLARLLFRFYDVTDGRILLDGQDIRSVTQHSLRAAIGIVPQDTVLFNDTLYYNLAYARPGVSHEEVATAARLAQLHDFIAALPAGYDTVVGERGLKLSGGEKQRVAIARALLKRPRLLVFDEATSALDSQSEQAILQALRAVAAEHTTLVIAHRLSTIVDADQILVLDHGRVREQGTHRELLQRDGLYAQMWALQQREQATQEEERLLGLV
ncbi:MAG TPA: ABC transporter ATP-binding protein/permease [Candidatus Competibacteraceae bacterium]|nr:ABC transporter ATP-binding protein/permease [Candidatus Competibacteraceae bacterium]HQA26519.1 ABC transporter ATP-binding protein/permease [Candidatus Competibacteraceae bacterium]HQD57237.1 ABC transporter ATP-binding protein/permease [Candidatus Competibacteraceae bacterium]